MSDFEYGIGGTERPTDASEAISQLSQNKTLVVQKLTAEESFQPEIVSGLTNVNSVFEHFRPNLDVEFTGEDGQSTKENLQFNNLADFGPKGLTKQSNFLQQLNLKQEEMHKIIKQLRSNKILMKAMQDPQAKAAFIEVIQGMIAELDQ